MLLCKKELDSLRIETQGERFHKGYKVIAKFIIFEIVWKSEHIIDIVIGEKIVQRGIILNTLTKNTECLKYLNMNLLHGLNTIRFMLYMMYLHRTTSFGPHDLQKQRQHILLTKETTQIKD